MSMSDYYSSGSVNECGCCRGLTTQTPVLPVNKPGLQSIAYRTGDHARFKNSLLARLSSKKYPHLANLKTRDDNEFTIALLDGWSTVSDVLTFYQERIANESYLRTATERMSLVEMSRLIGYRLNPGVAASTYIAFTMEEAPGDPDKATQSTTIDIGTRVQSTPKPDENPQSFETIEKITAHVRHNSIRPRLTAPQEITEEVTSVTIKGMDTNIRPGDKFLIILGPEKEDRIIRKTFHVSVDEEHKTTVVDFMPRFHRQKIQASPSLLKNHPASAAPLYVIGRKPGDHITDQMIWMQNDLKAYAAIQNLPLKKLMANRGKRSFIKAGRREVEVHVFRQRASLFGYNAPRYEILHSNNGIIQKEWGVSENDKQVFLDRIYEGIVPGSYAAIHKEGTFIGVSKINQAEARSRSDYGISSQTSWLSMDLDVLKTTRKSGHVRELYPVLSESINKGKNLPEDNLHEIRTTILDIQSENLELAQIRLSQPIEGDEVVLDDFYPDLDIGNRIIFTGEPLNYPGTTESEVVELVEVCVEQGLTRLRYKPALQNRYQRDSLYINGNVAAATHGESVYEVLGSGDARKPFQKFVLKQKPLTYVSSATAGGSESSIEVRVNDLLWKEVDNFYNRKPDEHIYITHIDDDGNTHIQFGDGKTGARLPSGANNIRARFRKGTGLDGLLEAKQLNLLLTRPLGLKEGINPLPTNGAADPETRDEARTNLPLTVLTLDRIVSLKDYEDFSRAFAGITKAQAIRVRQGQSQGVFLTVAGSKGSEVPPRSALYNNLTKALRESGDPFVNVAVKSFRPAYFRVEGGLFLDSRFLDEKVVVDVKSRLKTQFSFSNRHFGQPVTLSEVIACIQSVSGIVAVDIDRLYRFGHKPELQPVLIPEPARQNPDGGMTGAELLILDISSLNLLKVLS